MLDLGLCPSKVKKEGFIKPIAILTLLQDFQAEFHQENAVMNLWYYCLRKKGEGKKNKFNLYNIGFMSSNLDLPELLLRSTL